MVEKNYNVPESLIKLSKTYQVHCNLRPDQREEINKVLSTKDKERIFLEVQVKMMLDNFMSEPIHPYLKSIDKKTRVAMLLQGYDSKKLCVVTTLLESVYWDREDYPRLDFTHPEELREIIGGGSIWGEFVIAIAPVNASAKIFGQCVSDENLFIEVIKQNGFPIKRTQKERIEYGMGRIPEFLKHKELILGL